MATSLRDIPGSRRSRKVPRAERDLWAPPRPTTLDLTPGSLRLGRPRRPALRPSGQVDLFLWLLVIGSLAVAAWLGSAFWKATRIHVEMTGVRSGQALVPRDAADLAIGITLSSTDELFRSRLTVDGIDVLDDLPRSDDGLTVLVRPAELVEQKLVDHALSEGPHEIRLSVGRMFLADAQFTWSYLVDSLPPALDLPTSLDPVPIADPVTVSGTVEEGAQLQLAGEPVDIDGGRFEVSFDRPPTGALEFIAIDEAGNRTVTEVVVPVEYPERSRAVHVTAAAWADDEKRAGVLDLIDRQLIDTVELDLKDEAGVIGYDSQLRRAREIGAVKAQYDLAEAIEELEGRGVRVIGRLVAFRDPIYARAAWRAGDKDQVLQTPDGDMLSTYGGFANYAHPAVREYNLAIALEAVDLGLRDVLWDYIRRPEGDPTTMEVPGLDGTSAEMVAGFLRETHAELRARGAYQGASVFGIAAAAGNSIAQDVPRMAQVVDYLAPMIYPSHWGPGMYRVPNPITEPYEITKRSLADFQRVTQATGVRMLPWIQDFTLNGVTYGPAEVRAQIDAAAELGIEGFLLWNPNVRYTPDALTPIP